METRTLLTTLALTVLTSAPAFAQERAVPRRPDNGQYDNRHSDNRRDERRDADRRYDNRRYDNRRHYRPRVIRPTFVRVAPYRPYIYYPTHASRYGYTPRGYYEALPGRYYGGVRITGAPRDAAVFADGYYVGIVDDFDGIFQHMNLEAGPHRIEIDLGYDAVAFDVYVRPGQTTTFRY
jgi:hypothetical protein